MDQMCSSCNRKIEPGWPHYAKDGHCVECGIWLENIREKELSPERFLVIDNHLYYIGLRSFGPNRGFGGREFRFQREGKEAETCADLWHKGEVPERFRDRLTNNAKWAEDRSQKWMIAPDGNQLLVEVIQGAAKLEDLDRETDLAFWYFHLWEENDWTYTQIEEMVQKGVLVLFTCPVAGCDCRWEKVTK